MSEYESVSYPAKRTKTGKASFISKQRYIWIENYGEIPEGFVIHHINGDKKDNRIENLQCLSRKEHAQVHIKKKKESI
jgi:hypothetical protein